MPRHTHFAHTAADRTHTHTRTLIDTHRFDRTNSDRFMRFDNPSRCSVRYSSVFTHTHTRTHSDEDGVKPVAFKVNLPIGFGLYVSCVSGRGGFSVVDDDNDDDDQ